MSINSKELQVYNTKLKRLGQQLRVEFKNQVVALKETAGGQFSRVTPSMRRRKVRGIGRLKLGVARTEPALENSIKDKYKSLFGEINRISYSYPRHGYYFKKGVGSGYRSVGNGVIRIAKTDSGKHRTPKDWFAPLDKYEQLIANAAMNHYGDKVLRIAGNKKTT